MILASSSPSSLSVSAPSAADRFGGFPGAPPARRRPHRGRLLHRVGDPGLPRPGRRVEAREADDLPGVHRQPAGAPALLGALRGRLAPHRRGAAEPRPPRPRPAGGAGTDLAPHHAERRRPAPEGRKPAGGGPARTARPGGVPRPAASATAARRSRWPSTASTRAGSPPPAATPAPVPTATWTWATPTTTPSACPPARDAVATSSRRWSSSAKTVPRRRTERAFTALRESDALLVVGSSLMVWSGYRFAREAVLHGKPLVLINLGPHPRRRRSDAQGKGRLRRGPAGGGGAAGDVRGSVPRVLSRSCLIGM